MWFKLPYSNGQFLYKFLVTATFSLKQIAVTGTVRANRMENAPLQDLGKMAKKSRGTWNIVTDVSSNMTAVRWKDGKIVNAPSTSLEKNRFSL